MKKVTFGFFLLVGLASQDLLAQRGNMNPEMMEQRLEEMFQKMVDKLQLSDEQLGQFKEINTRYAKEEEGIKAVIDEQRSKLKDVRAKKQEEFKAVLTPEQAQEFKAMQERTKERISKRFSRRRN